MESLYKASDPVHILVDSDFFMQYGNVFVDKEKFAGPGVLKAYSPMCPHCVSKVPCIKELGKLFEDEGLAMYVINITDNPHFNEARDVKFIPAFFAVDEDLRVSDTQLTVGKEKRSVGTVEDIVMSVCDNKKKLCAYIDQFKGKCAH